MPPHALIEARDISKHYAGLQVISNISLAIQPGEIITLIGPNGAGKTTLLKLLLGLEKPDAGVVTRAAKLRIGYIPQQISPPTSLPMDVRYFLNLYAKPDAEIIARLGVDHYMDASLQTLSGGQWRRVLLARALSQKPQLLILDEPTQGVDIHGQAEFYEHIAKARTQLNCAVLMVSHDLHVVMAASDRVICIQHHICCEGAPLVVRDDPAFIAMFGQKLADNLALYEHHHSHKHDDAGHVVGLKASGVCAHEAHAIKPAEVAS
jgi:zinc transport system ATP-binding protein